jgi:polyphenol oxidase
VQRTPEVLEPGLVPLWRHADWRGRFPWLIQGTTATEPGQDELDYGLFGRTPTALAMERWRRLREATGMDVAVHARQVHGARIACWTDGAHPGLAVVDGYDAHLSDARGILLTVSVADCVPAFLVDERRRAVALAHAGWRGVAGGVLESTMERMTSEGSQMGDLWLHLGPSICGRCYEVGPEVHAGVFPERAPPVTPAPIDLLDALRERAERLGVAPRRVSGSGHCTRCGPGKFFSYRAGSAARQLGVLGVLK